MRINKIYTLSSILFFLLVFSPILFSQDFGAIQGRVIDANEKFPLPTVRVSILGKKFYTTTDAEGNYYLPSLPAGTYNILFELSGYISFTAKGITVTKNETTELNVELRMGFAHEMTVTARREIESLQKVPHNIEVLTTTELEGTPVANVLQALNNITGVDVETGSGITTVGTFMSINGYDDVYIKKMVDGVDVTAVVTNWSMLNAYPQEMMDQVEIIKGGTSSVWGANMGGIINVVTKRPRDLKRPIISLKGIFSTFKEMDFGDASAIPQSGNIQRYSGSIIGNYQKLGYMFGIKRDVHDLFTDNNTERNFNTFAKIGYDLSDSTYLDIFYSYNKIKVTDHMFLKTDLFEAWGFPYYWNYNDDAWSSTQAGYLKISSNLAPSFNLEAQLKFNRMEGEFTRIWLEGGLINGPTGTSETNSFMDQKVGFTFKGSYNPSTEFSLVSGVDYYRIKADFTSWIPDQPIIYVDSIAPFINAEYRLGPMGFHAGARYDYDSSFGSQLSPSVGFNINFLKSTILRLNVARTFKVPDLWYTLGESYVDQILPNPDLKPERAWAFSAGFESQELEYLWIKLSGYKHKMTDGIIRVPHSTPGRFTWGNATEFDRKGYEAEIGVMIPFGLTAYLGTNYNKHENISEGEIIEWIPTRTYKSGLKYKNARWNFMANLRGRWIWWNEGDFLMMLFEPRDKVWMFDLRLSKGFKITEAIYLDLLLDIYNFTNQLYWDRKDIPNPRRRFEFGFDLKFK